MRADAPVKVLGGGEITVAVQVSAHAFSASAKEKIAAAGGTHAPSSDAVRTVGRVRVRGSDVDRAVSSQVLLLVVGSPSQP